MRMEKQTMWYGNGHTGVVLTLSGLLGKIIYLLLMQSVMCYHVLCECVCMLWHMCVYVVHMCWLYIGCALECGVVVEHPGTSCTDTPPPPPLPPKTTICTCVIFRGRGGANVTNRGEGGGGGGSCASFWCRMHEISGFIVSCNNRYQ